MVIKKDLKLAVVIPAYKCKDQIGWVIDNMPLFVQYVIVVDDYCPEFTGNFVSETYVDPRIIVIKNKSNLGVGGAVIAGYLYAMQLEADIMIKIDGDGQMDPALISNFIDPIACGRADYTKGNRFFDLETVKSMPKIRLFGNAVLSFITKISSGYWNIFDPTNGYTAIHVNILKNIPLHKISKGYFFESDILFRLNGIKAVVVDVPMYSRYSEEISNLKITKVILEFSINNLRNFLKRIIYNYYLRDMSLASIQMPIGLVMLFFGVIYGAYHWALSASTGVVSPAGSVMISALPILMGIQFLLAFIGYDISSVPSRSIHRSLNITR